MPAAELALVEQLDRVLGAHFGVTGGLRGEDLLRLEGGGAAGGIFPALLGLQPLQPPGEGVGQSLEAGGSFPGAGDLPAQDAALLPAGGGVRKVPDLGDGHPALPQGADEVQPVEVLLRVLAEAVPGPLRGGKEPLFFIIPQDMGGDTGPFRDFLDGEVHGNT